MTIERIDVQTRPPNRTDRQIRPRRLDELKPGLSPRELICPVCQTVLFRAAMRDDRPSGRINVVGLTGPGRLVYAPAYPKIEAQCVKTEHVLGVPRPEPEPRILALHAECKGCLHKSEQERFALSFRPTIEASGTALEHLRKWLARPRAEIHGSQDRCADLATVSVLTEYSHAWGEGMPGQDPSRYQVLRADWASQAPWLEGLCEPKVVILQQHRNTWRTSVQIRHSQISPRPPGA